MKVLYNKYLCDELQSSFFLKESKNSSYIYSKAPSSARNDLTCASNILLNLFRL